MSSFNYLTQRRKRINPRFLQSPTVGQLLENLLSRPLSRYSTCAMSFDLQHQGERDLTGRTTLLSLINTNYLDIPRYP